MPGTALGTLNGCSPIRLPTILEEVQLQFRLRKVRVLTQGNIARKFLGWDLNPVPSCFPTVPPWSGWPSSIGLSKDL